MKSRHHGHQLCPIDAIASPTGRGRLRRTGLGADWRVLLAVHSMLGYAGGFVGPLMIGRTLDLSGGMSQLGWGMSFLSVAMLMVLALITFWLIRPRELEGDKGKGR